MMQKQKLLLQLAAWRAIMTRAAYYPRSLPHDGGSEDHEQSLTLAKITGMLGEWRVMVSGWLLLVVIGCYLLLLAFIGCCSLARLVSLSFPSPPSPPS